MTPPGGRWAGAVACYLVHDRADSDQLTHKYKQALRALAAVPIQAPMSPSLPCILPSFLPSFLPQEQISRVKSCHR
eukprot:COSAG01_NODE_1384_length_10514_cov_17.435046_2_plen_76_part_00